MPPKENSNDWLGHLSWQGYPRLSPIKDIAGAPDPDSVPPRPRKGGDVRVETLARENEALRAKIDHLAGLVAEFERRLSGAASAYEGAALESDSARRMVMLDNARLTGELDSARAELARREAREHTREADLIERERRADSDKALLEARRKLNDLESELAATRNRGAELAGSIGELRRQAAASHERLIQAKTLTDQDVQILRAEMREFLAKFHRIQETFGETP